jgi:transcriptional regulator with XRE-family HTH domain
MTQRIFADRLGRSKSLVVKIEGGARSAGRLAMLDLICDVLQVDLSILIGQEPDRRAEICLDNAEVERIQSALEHYPLAPKSTRRVLKPWHVGLSTRGQPSSSPTTIWRALSYRP